MHVINEEDVRQVARLARLRLEEPQVAELARQLGSILAYIDKLSELDVTGVQPLAHPLPMTNVLREDEPSPALPVDTVLAGAPQRTDAFFGVPKILGDAGGSA